MVTTEQDIKFIWDTWGDTKPWYCPKCDSLLAPDVYSSCDGTDEEIPKNLWKPHENVFMESSVTFEQFSEITKRQNDL